MWLKLTNALLAYFCVTLGTGALVWALGIYTFIFTSVLTSGTLIKVPAGNTIWVKGVPTSAGTAIWPFSVLAGKLAWRWSALTFIHVNASGPRVVWDITSVTNTTVGSHGIDAVSIFAEIGHFTFINIKTINRKSSFHADFVIFRSTLSGAVLTHRAPCQTHRTAAVSLGHL